MIKYSKIFSSKKLTAFICLLLSAIMLCSCNGGNTTPSETTGDLVTTTTYGTTKSSPDGSDDGGNNPQTPPQSAFDESNIVLSFGAISDIHLTGTENDQAENYFRSAVSQLKSKASEQDKNGLDAIAIAGDIADTGKTAQVEQFVSIIEDLGIDNIMLTTGNHDNDSYTDKVYLSDFYEAMGNKYFACAEDLSMLDRGAYHCVVDGYHFIFLAPTAYANYGPYDSEVITWLDTTLHAITEQSPNSYVFLYTHPMIWGTTYGSNDEIDNRNGLATKYLTQTLSKYPQVITFSGHLHFPINDERSIMQTSFTSVGTGAVRGVLVENGFENVDFTRPPKRAEVSSGLLVQVDANGNIRLTRMYFSKNTTFKEPWELSHPTSDGAHLKKYKADRSNGNQAPVLNGEIELALNMSSATGLVSQAVLSITAAADDNFAHHYLLAVKNEDTGETKNYRYISDFYLAATPDKMAKTVNFTIPSDILKVGEYTVSLTAVDSWGAKSNTLSRKMIISSSDTSLGSELPDAYADFEFAGGTATDKNGKFNIKLQGATVSEKSLTFKGNTKTVGTMNVTASWQYADVSFKDYTATTVTDFYNSATGFSVEVLYVNRAPSGTQGIVCGTDSPGGWGIASSNGTPYLYTYTEDGGINAKASSAASTTELTHIVATVQYDSTSDTTYTYIYVNGVLASSGERTGKVKAHPDEALATTFYFGADTRKNGAEYTAQYFMTDFSLADVKIYSSALNYKQVETAYNNTVSIFNN